MLVVRSLLASLAQVYTHISITLVSSLISLAAYLPFLILLALLTLGVRSILVIPICILIFLGVLPYPGDAASQVIARELATSDLIVNSDAWKGFDGNWQPALRAWLVGIAVTVGLIANVAFYTHLATTPGSLSVPGYALSVAAIAALSVWITMHFYLYPLLLAMEDPRLLPAYRNALVLIAFYPVTSLAGALVWIVWLAVCSVTGVFFAGGYLVAAAIQQNIFTRLPAVRRT